MWWALRRCVRGPPAQPVQFVHAEAAARAPLYCGRDWRPRGGNACVPAGTFIPVERELVFDIDLTDYDDVRTCGKEGHICTKCWPLMAVAIKVRA